MTTAAEGALKFIFNPTPADKALILTDEASFEIAAVQSNPVIVQL